MRGSLRHLSLKTRDLAMTERFYTDVLGLRVAFRAPPKRIFFSCAGGGDLLDFVKARGPLKPNQGLDHFGFKVTRRVLASMEKKLRQSGVEIEGRRGRDSVYFRDPNGYWLELYCD